VCLLVVAFQLFEDAPLLIGANRDEFLNRPAVSMTVLHPEAPRVLGGQDKQSGGTWLAINEWGVFAGLTNQPRESGRDDSRRTRGELPLALTAHADAGSSVDEFVTHYHSSDYNGCWLLVGDRDSLFFLDFTGLVEPKPEPLPPGLHVLENRPLGVSSPKTARIRAALADLNNAKAVLTGFRRVLTDHAEAEPEGPQGPQGPRSSANCVHLDGYGTRSSCIVECEADVTTSPHMWVADGPPCTEPFVNVTAWWKSEPSAALMTAAGGPTHTLPCAE
jgi:uncharacterized protein with NRDE domain